MKMKKSLLLFAFLVLSTSFGCAEEKQPVKKSSFDEIVASRRSVRKYDATKTISEAEVRQLIATTQEAPSWANQQSTRYYVAMSKEKVDAVKEMVGRNKQNIAGAPVVIVSTYVKGKSGFFAGNPTNEVGDGWGAYDNGLSNAYLILKAREMGFDTLIMGMRDAEKIRELFGIPAEEAIMAVISLGYRVNDPIRPQRKALDDILKFY
jgi:nitroreductase